MRIRLPFPVLDKKYPMPVVAAIGILLCFASPLTAQNYQNAVPQQQTKADDDCYTRNLDNGNAALRRSEARAALRFFETAKNCPEVQGNSRRQSELDARIEKCEEQLGTLKYKPEAGETPAAANDAASKPAPRAANRQNLRAPMEAPRLRRNYPASRTFLKNDDADCFEQMVAEADRAFRLQFWEDAAALYRAAKNCNNADQNDRQDMSAKITACRNAAENELFAKQQEAERQARHAIAANRADDAHELLRSTDRSLAFRLADFANQFIAPDDNADCVQAMFDAWYYTPADASKSDDAGMYRPALCYELADNLGENTSVKFQRQKDGSQWLWAFVPKDGDMFAWEMPGMRLVQTFGTGDDNGYKGFDFSPDGETILFWGNNFFELRRETRTYRIDVTKPANWCFSARSDEFFYEDVSEKKIYAVDLRNVFPRQRPTRKNTKNANLDALQQISAKREFVTGIGDSLCAMQYHEGKFWLGYNDRIIVISKPEWGKSWRTEQTYPFASLSERSNLHLLLSPQNHFALWAWDGGGQFVTFGQKDTSSQKTNAWYRFEDMYPMAVSATGDTLAMVYWSNEMGNNLLLRNTRSEQVALRQPIAFSNTYARMSGNFSQDGRWLAAPTAMGNIVVWAMHAAPTLQMGQIPADADATLTFSMDGNHLFKSYNDTLTVFDTDAPETPLHVWSKRVSGRANDWVVVQVSAEEAEARSLTSGRVFRFASPETEFYTVDSEEKNYIAYLSEGQRIVMRSLKTGEIVASKTLEMGTVSALRFVPGGSDLLIIQNTSTGEFEMGRSNAKIWSPLQPGAKPRPLRLQDYRIQKVSLDGQGRAAFSNGLDIRVFELSNPDNEVLKILSPNAKLVQAIAFRENSNMLAAAHSDGEVVFWNLATGQQVLSMQVVPPPILEGEQEIVHIAFSDEGSRLRVVTSNGRIYSYEIDPSYLHGVVQDENRHLQSFSPEQVRRYELESALYYPGNFERLAESGDLPLVRTFFTYFREEAVESNNIERVRDYCERAFYLYARLGPNTQEIWQTDMAFMYEDYALKLLLRGKTDEAEKVAAFLTKQFGRRSDHLMAHTALLRHDFPSAASRYSEFFLIDDKGLPYSDFDFWNWEFLVKQLEQLREIELLDSSQINCVCGVFGKLQIFQRFCPDQENYTAASLSPVDRARWAIYQKRLAASYAGRFADKVELLESANESAQNLTRQNAATGLAWQESTAMDLATAYRASGVFEQTSPLALTYFERATQLLTGLGAFKKLPDTARLSLLTNVQLAWGTQLLNAGEIRSAATHFDLGRQSAQQLIDLVKDTLERRIYGDHLIGPLLEKTGSAYLLLGFTTEARQLYELANNYLFMYGGLNPAYFGSLALMENNEDDAFINFGALTASSDAALGLMLIDRLIVQFPEQRARLQAFVPRLRAGFSAKAPRIAPLEINYWYAYDQSQHYYAHAQWDSAVVWAKATMAVAKELSVQNGPNKKEWQDLWLDQHVNVPYYLLLSHPKDPATWKEAMAIAEAGQDFVQKLGQAPSRMPDEMHYTQLYGHYQYLKTNLAHALILRNGAGDRERAIDLYKTFLSQQINSDGSDSRDLLEKDFRDLTRAGARAEWPDLKTITAER